MMDIYPPGSIIAGRYEVAGRPLMGGMGIVYLCMDREKDHPVALKTFKSEYLPDRATRDLFLREGTAWVELGYHPHIVCCYKVIKCYVGQEVYLVLELVAKEQGYNDASLRSWLMPGRPLPLEQALLFTMQIARGMKHATETIPGLVHRDLKPENVLVGADKLPGTKINRLRVTDFGLARVMESQSLRAAMQMKPAGGKIYPGRTQLSHNMVGTPLYMAPEQWRNEAVGIYTDVYALGCILYEMLAGYPAVDMTGMVENAEIGMAHCEGRLRSIPNGLPPAAIKLVQILTAIDPCQRPNDWNTVEGNISQVYYILAGALLPQYELEGARSAAKRLLDGYSYDAIGLSYLDIRKFEVAVGYFERAVNIGQMEKEPELEAAGLCNLGIAQGSLGDLQRAIRNLEQSLAIARKIGNREGEGSVLSSLGTTYDSLGEIKRAIGYYEQALAIARQIGNRLGEAHALGNLGVSYKNLGEARRAIGYYEQALAIASEIGDQVHEGNVLENLANACVDQGDLRRAIRSLEQALAIASEIGDRKGEGTKLVLLGLVYAALGEDQRAIGHFEQALAIEREIGNRAGEGDTMNFMGKAYYNLGDMRRAIEYCEQSLIIAREIGDRALEGRVLASLGNAYQQTGDMRRAIEYDEQYLVITRMIGDRSGEMDSLYNLGLTYNDLGDSLQAIDYLEQAVTIAREIGDRDGEYNALGLLGSVSSNLGDLKRAIEYFKQALTIAQEIGDVMATAKFSFCLAAIFFAQGLHAEALRHAEYAAQEYEQLGDKDGVQRAQQLIIQLRGQRR